MSIENVINEAWEKRDQINPASDQSLKDTINQVIDDLDSGKSRVAEKINGEWITHQHLKKAIMLSFRLYPMENLNGPYSSWYDKAHLLKGKTAGWTKNDHDHFLSILQSYPLVNELYHTNYYMGHSNSPLDII
mgnify:CR=1 FL=1